MVKLIEPVYQTLVCAFYASAEVYIDLCIKCTLRGVKIRLDANKICKIVGVSSDGLNVDDMETWPNILGFVVSKAIHCLCNLPTTHGTMKLKAQSLSLKSRILHHIVTYSFIP